MPFNSTTGRIFRQFLRIYFCSNFSLFDDRQTIRSSIDHSFRFFRRFDHFPVVLSLTAYACFFASCRVCCIAKFQLVVSYWLEHRAHDFSIEETIPISEFYRSISDTSAISYFVELQPAFVLICVYSLGYYYWHII